MRIQKVLDTLSDLLSSWGIMKDDWILVSQYAYKLLGYDVKLREGHFNILVRAKKIPWKVREGVEVHPPRNSKFRKDFKDFIDRTGFDFDINLSDDYEFKKKEGKYKYYVLPSGNTIRVQKPMGAVREFEKLLALSTDEGFGQERIKKDISYIRDMIKALRKRHEKDTLSEFERLLSKYLRKKTTKGPKVIGDDIFGIAASKGRVVGKAAVFSCVDDLTRISKGDVLVTQMTTPICTPLLPNVGAIVTDKGGQLSHAAILAREMKVPCVVGTLVATKLLKTGDIVEVDGESGLVRKLKK